MINFGYTIDPEALARIEAKRQAAHEAAALQRQRRAEVTASEAELRKLDARLLAGDDTVEALELATASARVTIAEKLAKFATGAAERASRDARIADLDTAEAAASLMRGMLEQLPITVTDRLPEKFNKSKLPAVWAVQGAPTAHLGAGYIASDSVVHLVSTSKLVTGPTVQQITTEARARGWIDAGLTGATLPREIQSGIWDVTFGIGGPASVAALFAPAPRLVEVPDGLTRRPITGQTGVRVALSDYLERLNPRKLGYSGKGVDCNVSIRPLSAPTASDDGVLWQTYGVVASPIGAPAEWGVPALRSLQGKLLPGIGVAHKVEILTREPFEHKMIAASYAELRVAFREPAPILGDGEE